ncbi:MAG: HNH endonuclease signature motif containing protein [Terrimicrobiaceae bacterium]
MNYQKIYDQIIEKARKQNREKGKGVYYESHHIIPKCLGGSNRKDNRVLLTAKEHYICHLLLYVQFPTSRKLAHAFMLMCNFSKNKERKYKYSSRVYEEAKKLYVKYRKQEQPKTLQKYWTEQKKKERSIKYSGKGNPNYGNKGHLSGENNPAKRPDVREKLSLANLGKPKTLAHIAKIVASKKVAGHYENLSTRRKKPVLNVETGEIYESRSAAAMALRCNVSTVDEKRKKGFLKYIEKEVIC